MLREQLPDTEFSRLNDYLEGEFTRCSQILNLFEQHAITYLSTANGGGAAVVIGFAGSAQYAEGAPLYALFAFLLGLIAVGVAIAVGHKRLSLVCSGFAADHRDFCLNTKPIDEVHKNHHARFNQWRYGVPFAYISSACLLIGIALSTHAFLQYPDWKAAKELKAEQKKAGDVPINVTCLTPAPDRVPPIKKGAHPQR